jgi:endonuclease/exonuclease/phosphatase (EEP) superfamily protein YafD
MFSRFFSPLVGLGSAAVLSVAFWPQLIGFQRTWPLAGIVALRGSAIVVAVVLILVLLLVSRLGRPVRRITRPIAFWLVIFVAASAWILTDRGWGITAAANAGMNTATTETTTTPDSTSDSANITVLSWNTMGDKPAASAIATLALDHHANVVVLAETSAQAAQKVADIMNEAGTAVTLHSISFDTDYIGHSTSLLIADALGEYRIDDTAVPTNGQGPTIVAAHSVSPRALSIPLWREDLSWLQRACERDNVILAGDLNATVDNLSGLTTGDGAALGSCLDAAVTTDNAAVGTWPAWAPAWLGSPIDHVMASPSWTATAFQVLTDTDGGGADHHPIVATLHLS